MIFTTDFESLIYTFLRKIGKSLGIFCLGQGVYIQTHFSVLSPTKCWFQAIVCGTTPKMYLQSGYLLPANVTFLIPTFTNEY